MERKLTGRNDPALAVVVRSVNDATGTRCVDIMRDAAGRWSFRECRRDPEDSFGWRSLADGAAATYASEGAAFSAARAAVGWLE